jgi:hypothetical protein
VVALRFVSASALLTLVLGCSVAVAFYLVGGSDALRGAGVVTRSWPLIYPLVTLFAAGLFYVVGLLAPQLSGKGMVGLVLAAWIGELLVLASGLVDDDLDPLSSVFVWLLATGGPVQPMAGLIGAWLAKSKPKGP